MSAASPAGLATVFGRIAETRMAGLPIINSALTVEAIGFRAWQDGSLGVLITPWFMNLIWLPGEAAGGPVAGSRTALELPCGQLEFIAAEEDGIGLYLSCSLFSPMGGFADMAAARAVAEAVMVELFQPAAPAPGLSERLERPVSRRGFFSALLPTERRP